MFISTFYQFTGPVGIGMRQKIISEKLKPPCYEEVLEIDNTNLPSYWQASRGESIQHSEEKQRYWEIIDDFGSWLMKILESYSLVELDITTIKYIWTLLYIHFYHAPFLSDKFTFHSLEMGNNTNMFAWCKYTRYW